MIIGCFHLRTLSHSYYSTWSSLSSLSVASNICISTQIVFCWHHWLLFYIFLSSDSLSFSQCCSLAASSHSSQSRYSLHSFWSSSSTSDLCWIGFWFWIWKRTSSVLYSIVHKIEFLSSMSTSVLFCKFGNSNRTLASSSRPHSHQLGCSGISLFWIFC